MSRLATACFAFVLFALAGCGGGGTLSEQELTKEIEAVGSAAAEGALLATGAADGRTTSPFTKVQSEVLAEQASKTQATLSAASVPAGLEERKLRAAELAGRVATDLRRLHDDPGNSRLAERTSAELESAAKAAEVLAR